MGDTADFDKHTEAELREGVRQAARQEPRIAEEGSEAQLEAERRQREAMESKLDGRED
ncbi:MAG: hypothetical protein ACRDU8_02495 [Egibacteraceae bacterium]